MWLRTGEWLGLSLATVIAIMAPTGSDMANWVRNPDAWIGLHRIVSGIPLVFWLIGLGGAFASRL